MHILLSNDDGYLAEGLTALANALREHAEISELHPIETAVRRVIP